MYETHQNTMKLQKLHFKKLLLYGIVTVALAAPLALAFPQFGYDLLTDMTTMHLTVIVASPVIAGALILCKLLWNSGRD